MTRMTVVRPDVDSGVRRRRAPRSRRVGTTTFANVLAVDAELGASLGQHEFETALRRAQAPLLNFPPGPWSFIPEPDPAAFGALVLRGLILLRIEAGTRAYAELLGPEDVISPWLGTGSELTRPSAVTATILADSQVALLDRDFGCRTARWPEIHAALLRRVIVRTRRLGLQSAINALPHIHKRLHLTLWQLAERFGRVTPAGIVLELPLTHAHLAHMTAAQRPSVTVAITQLEQEGWLARTARHRWILYGEPPPPLSPLQGASGLIPSPRSAVRAAPVDCQA